MLLEDLTYKNYSKEGSKESITGHDIAQELSSASSELYYKSCVLLHHTAPCKINHMWTRLG